MFKSFLKFIVELTKLTVLCAAIVIPIRYFLIQPFYVKGASMEPTFHTSEYLIVDEISYRFSEPKRGDVIVFRYPGNPQEYFIKRIIGLPGETVDIKNGDIYIYNNEFKNETLLEEEYLSSPSQTYAHSENNKIDLADNEYYVLGDNRNSSKDSRNFGSVQESFIVGKVLFRGWPFDKMGFFEEPSYEL